VPTLAAWKALETKPGKPGRGKRSGGPGEGERGKARRRGRTMHAMRTSHNTLQVLKSFKFPESVLIQLMMAEAGRNM
jgi:hypothetical protein